MLTKYNNYCGQWPLFHLIKDFSLCMSKRAFVGSISNVLCRGCNNDSPLWAIVEYRSSHPHVAGALWRAWCRLIQLILRAVEWGYVEGLTAEVDWLSRKHLTCTAENRRGDIWGLHTTFLSSPSIVVTVRVRFLSKDASEDGHAPQLHTYHVYIFGRAA